MVGCSSDLDVVIRYDWLLELLGVQDGWFLRACVPYEDFGAVLSQWLELVSGCEVFEYFAFLEKRKITFNNLSD